MNEINIHMESMTYHFSINEDKWQLKLAKSQTQVKDIRQLALITESIDFFVPAVVEDGKDFFTITFTVEPKYKEWKDILTLSRVDKLRLLCNLARLKELLSTRITFFLHPNNLVFDDNLMPANIYRGVRDLVPPYEIDEEKFVFQYKCLIVALFSNKYSFDELYSGALTTAKDTEFERKVSEINDFASLYNLLEESYTKEKKETEKNMQIVPKKQFRIFKRLAYSMIAAAVILAVLLAYFSFVKVPFQNHLIDAQGHFLSEDLEKVISDLERVDPVKLPSSGKYMLAYSYVKTEKMSPEDTKTIMKNISMKSDENYLLYWIYNGRGELDKSLDMAMYIDDPRLIIHGLIQRIEKIKNDPDLSSEERETQLEKYEDQLKKYKDKFFPDSKEETDESNVKDEKQSDDEAKVPPATQAPAEQTPATEGPAVKDPANTAPAEQTPAAAQDPAAATPAAAN